MLSLNGTFQMVAISETVNSLWYGLMMPYGDINLSQIWLVAWRDQAITSTYVGSSSLISNVLWPSSESNFTMSVPTTILCKVFENHSFKITAISHRGQWVKSSTLSCRQVSATYTSRSTKLKGVYWFHLVRLSVCGQNRVRSVSSTILARSIPYLHILSSNLRRCVVCKDLYQN